MEHKIGEFEVEDAAWNDTETHSCLMIAFACRLISLKKRIIFRRVCLFLARQPSSGPWPPHYRGFTITHNDAPQSVGLLWTSDQLAAETSTRQQTGIHAPGGIRTHSLSRRAAADLQLRPRGHWDWHFEELVNENWEDLESENSPSALLCISRLRSCLCGRIFLMCVDTPTRTKRSEVRIYITQGTYRGRISACNIWCYVTLKVVVSVLQSVDKHLHIETPVLQTVIKDKHDSEYQSRGMERLRTCSDLGLL